MCAMVIIFSYFWHEFTVSECFFFVALVFFFFFAALFNFIFGII